MPFPSPISPIRLAASALIAAMLAPHAAGARSPEPTTARPSVQEQIDALRQRYEHRIRELERRIEELETHRREEPESPDAPAAERTGPSDEITELREAAREAATEPEQETTAPRAPTVGHERDLSRFNPEISFTGDVVGVASDDVEDFDPREVELDLQSALDPFSTTKLTLAFSPEEGVDIEEAYVEYSGLATGLGLRAGKIRQSFGVLNRWHLHSLPQPDYPLVLTEYLGEEGLVQTGLSAEWLLPVGWADTNEVTLQLTDGSSDLFGGDDLESLSGLGRLTNYWDLSESAYLELGLSGVVGEAEPGVTSSVTGADLTLRWQPPGRAKYRDVTWRTEILRSDREVPSGDRVEAWGGYSYVEGLLRRNLSAGVRYDLVEDPLLPSSDRWAVTPYVTWWQSEFVRLRAAWQHREQRLAGDDRSDDRFTLQLTWAAGPHKHEKY